MENSEEDIVTILEDITIEPIELEEFIIDFDIK